MKPKQPDLRHSLVDTEPDQHPERGATTESLKPTECGFLLLPFPLATFYHLPWISEWWALKHGWDHGSREPTPPWVIPTPFLMLLQFAPTSQMLSVPQQLPRWWENIAPKFAFQIRDFPGKYKVITARSSELSSLSSENTEVIYKRTVTDKATETLTKINSLYP